MEDFFVVYDPEFNTTVAINMANIEEIVLAEDSVTIYYTSGRVKVYTGQVFFTIGEKIFINILKETR